MASPFRRLPEKRLPFPFSRLRLSWPPLSKGEEINSIFYKAVLRSLAIRDNIL
jgi:hypothetical protein